MVDYPEIDLEIVNMQITFWGNYRKGQLETVKMTQSFIDKTDKKLRELKEKKEELQRQIDAEASGHPSEV